MLAASGKTFTVAAADFPSGRGDGAHLNTLVNSGSDDIVWMGSGNPEQKLLMNIDKLRNGTAKLDDGAQQVPASLVRSSQCLCCTVPEDGCGLGETQGGLGPEEG